MKEIYWIGELVALHNTIFKKVNINFVSISTEGLKHDISGILAISNTSVPKKIGSYAV